MHTNELAIQEIRSKKKLIVKKFANPTIYVPVKHPFTIFMAGSPGAGKTEFSRNFNPMSFQYDSSAQIVRIDPDEIRKMLPQFKGHNSDEVQQATTIGVEKIFDHVQQHSQNVIVDTTFSDFAKAKSNIERSLSRRRKVGIFYIHLDPKIAWLFTKAREKKEGRSVNKKFFIDAYFQAKENVNKIKSLYPEIEVNLIEKIHTNNNDNPIIIDTKLNIDKIDNYINFIYNRKTLSQILKDKSY